MKIENGEYQGDDYLGKTMVNIPTFQGKYDTKNYLLWGEKMETVFNYYNYCKGLFGLKVMESYGGNFNPIWEKMRRFMEVMALHMLYFSTLQIGILWRGGKFWPILPLFICQPPLSHICSFTS